MEQPEHVFCIPRPSCLVQHIHARLRSLDIEIRTVRDVLDHYGLKLLRDPQNLPLGRRSRNVVVDTSGGRKVLKSYRPEWQVPTIIYGHSILARLAELSFPAPRLVATPSGDTFVTHNGRNYALFDFIDGVNYSSNYLPQSHWLRIVALAGRALARFHRELEGFVPEGHHHLGFKSYTEDRLHNLTWYVGQLNELKEKSRCLAGLENGACANWLVRNADRMLESLDWLDEVLGAAQLPRMVIHGDYAVRNWLFQRDGTLTPVDLELSRLEWRLSDLVTTLARFRHRNGAFDFESMRHFVSSYQTQYPMSLGEWRNLPELWRFRKLQGAVLFWKYHLDTEGQEHRLISAREAVEQADWVLCHQGELLALNPISVPVN